MAVGKQKIKYLNNLRVIACLAVVLCHVSANAWAGNIYEKQWIVLTIYNAISRFSVPIFVMISGALFLQRDTNIRHLYSHNILKLVIFLNFWGICYQVYHLYIDNNVMSISVIKEAFKRVLCGDTQVHLWYIYMLLGLYILSPVISTWIKNAKKEETEYLLIILFIFCSLYTLFSNLNNTFLWQLCVLAQKMSLDNCGMYIGYFILGYYLSSIDLSAKKRKICYFLGGFGLILCILFTVMWCRYNGMPLELFFEYKNPFIVFYSVAIFVFFKYNLCNFESKIVNTISECTLGIYGVHMFILFGLWNKGLTTSLFSPVLSVPVMTICVFVSSLLITQIIQFIPILKQWIA